MKKVIAKTTAEEASKENDVPVDAANVDIDHRPIFDKKIKGKTGLTASRSSKSDPCVQILRATPHEKYRVKTEKGWNDYVEHLTAMTMTPSLITPYENKAASKAAGFNPNDDQSGNEVRTLFNSAGVACEEQDVEDPFAVHPTVKRKAGFNALTKASVGLRQSESCVDEADNSKNDESTEEGQESTLEKTREGSLYDRIFALSEEDTLRKKVEALSVEDLQDKVDMERFRNNSGPVAVTTVTQKEMDASKVAEESSEIHNSKQEVGAKKPSSAGNPKKAKASVSNNFSKQSNPSKLYCANSLMDLTDLSEKLDLLSDVVRACETCVYPGSENGEGGEVNEGAPWNKEDLYGSLSSVDEKCKNFSYCTNQLISFTACLADMLLRTHGRLADEMAARKELESKVSVLEENLQAANENIFGMEERIMMKVQRDMDTLGGKLDVVEEGMKQKKTSSTTASAQNVGCKTVELDALNISVNEIDELERVRDFRTNHDEVGHSDEEYDHDEDDDDSFVEKAMKTFDELQKARQYPLLANAQQTPYDATPKAAFSSNSVGLRNECRSMIDTMQRSSEMVKRNMQKIQTKNN
eukprot:Nk52_evm81s158 gene=Nk52_evmTU81s158